MSLSIEQLQSMVANLEAQLVDLYAEKAQMPIQPNQAMATIASLEEQVVSLVDEKMELEGKIRETQHQIERMKMKSKVIGAAIMEAALFDSEEKTKKAA